MLNLTGIQVFSDAKIQEAVDRALSSVPDGKTGAVVAYVNTEGASLAVVAKLGDHWSVVGALEKDYTKPLSAEAEVRFAW